MCTVGSDALGEKTFEAWKAETGFPIWENYGTTESFHTILSTRMGENPRPKSVGKPVPGYEARVVDKHGRPCPAGVTAVLAVRGPTGIIYWNPRSNDGRLMQWQERGVREGWSMVGDLVVQDERANFYFIGREDDMIKSSGYRLSPEEIESVILGHPLVQESMVVGIPDEIRGQAIKALVVMKEGLTQQIGTESEIKDYCRRNMALYKVPHVFEFVSALPKTATGKVMRKHSN
jgi:2-aminobenzoate-CoA ligase